ncbi:50S ribosomal protein L20 [Candidatus Peregrinibacteria bacterium CG_4_10_14_0_2_um_filter_43_11]|nr:MAG: 50S ribosomal protein L20 [Candidatus Peregrinibacteria bacterium CG_4_10_14_0_2_um_filter_43_11]
MPRVKRGVTARARHKKIFKLVKGFRGKRKNVFKLAKNAVMKAGQNAYRDRRLKKRSFHRLWILRINAACRQNDMKYSRFVYGLELAGILINRKMLSELASNNPEIFKELVEKAKATLPPEGQAPDLEVIKKRLEKGKVKKEKTPKDEEEAEKEVMADEKVEA